MKNFVGDIVKSKIIWQSVLVGVLCGIIIAAFRLCIDNLFNCVTDFYYNSAYFYLLPLITMTGGLLSGILVFFFAPETKGSGIPFVKMSLQRSGRIIRVRTIFVKFFAGVCAIGSGLSLGREGPGVQLGAGAGSFAGNLFRLKNSNKDTLVAAGAGAAIAATFNAPIAGTLFVMEELLQKFSPSILFPCLAATVAASSITRCILGNEPVFGSEFVSLYINAETIISCIIVGLLAGVLGKAFSKTIFFFDNFYKKLYFIPNYLKPAIAGFVIGLTGLFLFYVLSGGNNVVEMLLDNKFPITMVLIIFIVKFIVTPLCFGSGAAGGIFLPMIMLGAFLGYIAGYGIDYVGFSVSPSAIAYIGMAAFLSAVARTPITATVMVFEMTGGYESILPLMLTAAVSDFTAEKLGQKPIYSQLLLDNYKTMAQAHCTEDNLVKDFMTKNVKVFSVDDDVKFILNTMLSDKHNAYPLADSENKLLGIITKADIEDVLIDKSISYLPAGRIMNPNPVKVYKTDNLYTCYYRLHNENTEWAIVIGEDSEIEGIITRADILNNL